MTEPNPIQRESSAQTQKPSGIQPTPSPPGVPGAAIPGCPHCDKSLTREDVAGGRCWYCAKRLADPVEPGRPQTPFLVIFLFGFVGAVLGIVVGLVLLGDKFGEGSWGVSLCGGIGFATGCAIPRSIFHKQL